MRFALDYLEQVPYEVLDDAVETQASAQEITARIARYMVIESMRLPFIKKQKIRIARNEVEQGGGSFIRSVGRVWTGKYGNQKGFPAGDIETTAAELGVFEDIWPEDSTLVVH